MQRSAAILILCAASCAAEPGQPASAADPALSPAHCQYATAPVPAGAGVPSDGPRPLLAGVGEARIDLPVGTPLGGYTARIGLLGGSAPDLRKSPYAGAFAPSVGVQTTPLVKALYLAAGRDRVVIIKVDLCAAYDRLVYDVEEALDRGGAMRGRVILSASHTHSGPATYQGIFHLALGFDHFREDQYQRLLGSIVSAARAAMERPRPARLGVGVWEGWDPDDEIYSDRRGEDDRLPGPDGRPIGKHKDGRLLVLRVDDEKDQPLALLFHFPIHGTVAGSDNALASVEASGHIELFLEERFDREVMVMHLQGAAGDASPRGRGGLAACDDRKMLCANFARMESVAELAAPRIFSLFQETPTRADLLLEVVTRAVENGRAIHVREGAEALSYAPYQEDLQIDDRPEAIYTPEGKVRSPITQFNVPYGAGLCGEKGAPLPTPGIEGASRVPYGSCKEIGAAVDFVARYLKVEPPPLPECQTTRTTLSALRLSGVPVLRRVSSGGTGTLVSQASEEDLLFVTLPGEPVSELADRLRRRSPAGPERTFVLGYAQGHIGYLLGVENWLLGGYEPSINLYGPLEGEWLMEKALALGALAWSREREDAEAEGERRRDRLVYPRGEPRVVARLPARLAGTVPDTLPAELLVRTRVMPKSAQPEEILHRISGRATFVFYGGHPGEDTPEVTLEREEPLDTWSVVRKRSGRPVGTRGREVLLTYTPVPLSGDDPAHLWAAEWQAVGYELGPSSAGIAGVHGLPVGRYRFFARGRADGREYVVRSRPFEVVREGALTVSAERVGQEVKGRAFFKVGAGYRLLRLGGPSDGEVGVQGTIRVKVTSKATGRSVEMMLAVPESGAFSVPVSGLEMSMGGTVLVRDVHGNSGETTF